MSRALDELRPACDSSRSTTTVVMSSIYIFKRVCHGSNVNTTVSVPLQDTYAQLEGRRNRQLQHPYKAASSENVVHTDW